MSDHSAFVPDGPLLVLSPHLDDAALSCGALLARTEPLTVLDVFTQRPEPEQVTDWDRRCGFRGSDDAIAARWAEEQAAFAASPHHFAAVDLLDVQYTSGPREEVDVSRIARAVDAWLREVGGAATVAVPVGAGTPPGVSRSLLTRLRAKRAGTFAFDNSPDHLFVRDAVLGHLRGRAEVDLVLYEDYPYRLSMRGDRLVPGVAAWTDRDVQVHDVPIDVAAKAARVAAYSSQLGLLFRVTDEAALAKVLPRTERYWRLTARRAA